MDTESGHSGISMSSIHLKVIRDNGSRSVYLVQPQHIPREDIPESSGWPEKYGLEVCFESNGRWFMSATRSEIKNNAALDSIEALFKNEGRSQTIRTDRQQKSRP